MKSSTGFLSSSDVSISFLPTRWDSIFVPDGEAEPFSCMSTEKKCELSHRSNAVVQWADWLDRNVDELWERQHGRPAIGHKGLDFKVTSSEQ